MWREVTLVTPQLWTTFIFRVKVCGCQSPYKIDVAREWFSRSRSLPLTMKIKRMLCKTGMRHYKHTKNYDFDSSVDLLRSHSTRWCRIHIDLSDSHPQLLHKLLENLPNQPTDLEFLSLGPPSDESGTFDKSNILLQPRSISQSDSHFDGVVVWDIPCGFERLTHMEMIRVPMDEVLHVFKYAPNLQDCRITFNNDLDLDDLGDTYPLPTTPIVARYIKHLTIGPSSHEFFTYLTLPSLQTLDYASPGITPERKLRDCLNRSCPPLQAFKFTVYLHSSYLEDWDQLLPDITSLTIDTTQIAYLPETSNRCLIIENLLAELARPSGTVSLPKLRGLILFTPGMSDAAWTSLCDIFTTGSPDLSSSLKEIEIHQDEDERWQRNFPMEAKIFEFFEGLTNAGVRLEVEFSSGGPKFGSCPSTAL